GRRVEAADALEGLTDLALLLLELPLVRQHLPRRARVRRAGLDAVRRGVDDLDRARLAVVALRLRHDSPDAIAGHRALDEHDVAVEPRHAVAAVGERVDRQLELSAALRPGRAGGDLCH